MSYFIAFNKAFENKVRHLVYENNILFINIKH